MKSKEMKNKERGIILGERKKKKRAKFKKRGKLTKFEDHAKYCYPAKIIERNKAVWIRKGQALIFIGVYAQLL